jgi:hypothetical protein
MPEKFPEELGFHDVETIDVKKIRMKRKDREFIKMKIAAEKRKGRKMSWEDGRKWLSDYKKKSDSQREKIRKAVIDDHEKYDETPERDEIGGKIHEKVEIEVPPGAKVVTPESKFEENEKPIELKLREVRQENKELKNQLKKQDKIIKELEKRLKKLEQAR